VKSIDEELISYIPKFKYILKDLNRLKDKAIIDSVIESKAVQSAILLLKKIFDVEVDFEVIIRDIFSNVRELFKSKEGVEIIRTFLLYLFNATDVEPEKVGLILKSVEKEGEEVAMSTAEVLIKKGVEQGLQQGLQQGLSKGEYKKAIETAKRMLERGSDIEFIADVTGLSIEEVEKIKNS
ncbi:MAG: hypothetical protein ACP5QT_06520, partial [Brevinematia bacterium]